MENETPGSAKGETGLDAVEAAIVDLARKRDLARPLAEFWRLHVDKLTALRREYRISLARLAELLARGGITTPVGTPYAEKVLSKRLSEAREYLRRAAPVNGTIADAADIAAAIVAQRVEERLQGLERGLQLRNDVFDRLLEIANRGATAQMAAAPAPASPQPSPPPASPASTAPTFRVIDPTEIVGSDTGAAAPNPAPEVVEPAKPVNKNQWLRDKLGLGDAASNVEGEEK